jgi:protein tyrosine/serine phosphatase
MPKTRRSRSPLAPANSAEWSRAFRTIKEIVSFKSGHEVLNNDERPLNPSNARDLDYYYASTLRPLSKTTLGDKLLKFVHSSRFASAFKELTRWDVEEIQAEVVRHIKPSGYGRIEGKVGHRLSEKDKKLIDTYYEQEFSVSRTPSMSRLARAVTRRNVGKNAARLARNKGLGRSH